jgi:hypothetical protein
LGEEIDMLSRIHLKAKMNLDIEDEEDYSKLHVSD